MTVEDGSGSARADSYAGLAVADAYHLARGNEAWGDGSAAAREAALVRACDYLERGIRKALAGSADEDRPEALLPPLRDRGFGLPRDSAMDDRGAVRGGAA